MPTKRKAVHWTRQLVALNACGEAVRYCKTYPSLQKAWNACGRGDWMLWLAGKLSGEPGSGARKKLVLCACECARLTLKHVPANEKRPLQAIETAERWARGEWPTLTDVRAAAAYAAAYAAADAAAADAAAADAAYAAYAAADAAAADAADDAAAAAAAAYAAYAAAYAAADDAADARQATLAECAAIVRKHYPKAPRLNAKAKP